MLAYWRNIFKLARNDRHLHPRVAVFYVTGQCNLNCAYCEEFGALHNDQTFKPLPLADVMRVLRVIRTGVDSLWLTGGEPLTHPDIDAIVTRAKRDLHFRELTLISNGLLLARHESLLPHLDRLLISLDSTDAPSWSATIGVSPAQAESILDNIRHYAGKQKEFGYQMIVNAVLTPQTLTTAERLLSFSRAHNLLISFSPQSFNNWPRYELIVSDEYKAFIHTLLDLKRAGAPILGSEAYFRNMLDLAPFDCYSTLVPRILANGDLTYPCRPFEKADNGQGGRPVSLLEVETWEEAWRRANEVYGQPPRSCHSCFQQCYTEPSLMQARPFDYAIEWLRYPAVRKGGLTTYAPG